jgi:GAF domain-containing protein
MFSEPGMEDHPETFFTKGIQEVSNALLSDYSLDDVLRIVLEATHRGLRFSGGTRTLLFVRDRERPVMNLRFGLGDALQDVKKWFTIPLGNTQDIFNIALSQGRDLIINDIDEPEVKPLFPEWYLTNISSGVYVILLPLVINNKPIGMLYADGPKGDFGRISKQSWNHLKILRDQSILAIRQKT